MLDLDLVSQTRQGIPTRIDRGLIAGALCKIQILTTAGAKPLAVRFAEGTTWQGEQHLLTHHILKQKTALLIIPDFGLICCNRTLAGVGIGTFGAEDKVKIALERHPDRIDAACAQDLELRAEMGPQPDIVDMRVGAAVLDQEIGRAFYRKRTDLADIGGKVQGTGRYGLIELKGLVDKLDRGNQHIVKRSRFAAEIKQS